MTQSNDINHITGSIDAYLAGGLSDADRRALETHVATCAACGDELRIAKEHDEQLQALFASAQPAVGFENDLVAALRPKMSRSAGLWNRPMLHPMVRRIATGVAAAVVLGAVGYGVQAGLEHRKKSAGVEARLRESTPAIFAASRPADRSRSEVLLGSLVGGGMPSTQPAAASAVWSAKRMQSQDARWALEQHGNGVAGNPGKPGQIGGQTAAGAVQQPTDAQDALVIPDTNGQAPGPNPATEKEKLLDLSDTKKAATDGDKLFKQVKDAEGLDNYRYFKPPTGQPAAAAADARYGEVKGLGGRSGSAGAGTALGYANAGAVDADAPAMAGGASGGGGMGGGGGGRPVSKSAAANGRGESNKKDSGEAEAAFDSSYYLNLTGHTAAGKPGASPAQPTTPAFSQPPNGPQALGGFTDKTKVQTLETGALPSLQQGLSAGVTLNRDAASDSFTAGPTLTIPGSIGSTAEGLKTDGKFGRPELGQQVAEVERQAAPTPAEPLLEAPKAQTSVTFRPAEYKDNVFGEHGKVAGDTKDAKEVAMPPPGADPSTAAAKADDAEKKLPAAAKPAAQPGEKSGEAVVTKETSKSGDPAAAKREPQTPTKVVDQGPNVVGPTPHVEKIERKIIRNGTAQFEVDSFESALATLTKIAAEEEGHISNTDSEKLPNGRVRGSVTVRCPPERLDTLVLKLRGIGDLKSQKITAEEVTKHFYDISSQLKAGRAMEERLLAIIKTGGAVKDLLEAEKQLGVWREKIELWEGEIRYIDSLVSMSTLEIELLERDVRAPTAAAENETVNTSVESEEVETSRADVIKAIEAAKGRIVDSQLTKSEGGQLSATIVADVPPDASGPVIDRLKQIGKVARLEISRKTTTQGGVGPIVPGLKIEHKETRFQISIYNLANVAPRQTTNLNLAAEDVEVAYKKIIDSVNAAGGRVVSSQLNRPKADQTVGTIVFQAPAEKAELLSGAVRAGIEVMRMEVIQNADVQNTTEAKRGFTVQIYSLAHVPAREVTTLQLAAPNVSKAFAALLEAAKTAGSRIVTSQLNEQDPNNVTGTLEFEVSREKWGAAATALQDAGVVVTRNVVRSQDTETTVDSKVRLSVTLIDDIRLAPRETVVAALATTTVQDSFAALVTAAKDAGARVVGSNLNVSDRTNPNGSLVFAVPRESAAKFETALKAGGVVVSRTVNRLADGPMNVESKIGFEVSIFDELRLTPRETVTAVIATKQVRETYDALGTAARESGARLVNSNLNQNDRVNPVGRLSFAVPKEKAAQFETALKAAGLTVSRTLTRQQDGPLVAENKSGFDVSIVDERSLKPRETQTMRVVTTSVTERYAKLLDVLRLTDAQMVQQKLVQENKDSTVGILQFIIRREDRPALEKALAENADVFDRSVERSEDAQGTVDHRIAFNVELRDADVQEPRRTITIAAETPDIDKAANDIDALALSLGGRRVDLRRYNDNGHDTEEVTVDVPLARTGEVLNGVRGLGSVVGTQEARDPKVPEGMLSRGRVRVAFRQHASVGASKDASESIREGLSGALTLLYGAIEYLIIGVVCLVLALVAFFIALGVFRLVRRVLMRSDDSDSSAPPTAPGDSGPAVPPAITPA